MNTETDPMFVKKLDRLKKEFKDYLTPREMQNLDNSMIGIPFGEEFLEVLRRKYSGKVNEY